MSEDQGAEAAYDEDGEYDRYTHINLISLCGP